MTPAALRTSIQAVRRLAVTKQHLAGKRPKRPSADRILTTIRELPYLQWDPVSVVAPSHLHSLWARVGPFRLSDFDRLLWKERQLLLHWIPFAAVVSAEDYPLYASLMRRYPESLSDSWGAQRERARSFLAAHDELRKRVLASLRRGPLQLRGFRDHARTKRDARDWEPSSGLSEMLWHLVMAGEVMVVGHEGNQNLYGLSESSLPSWVDRSRLSVEEADREAAQRALRGLGVATAKEVHHYFVRGCYADASKTLQGLVADSLVQRVVVDGLPSRVEQYVHAKDVELLSDLASDDFSPRVALLPPFDNMLYDPARGKRLFDFAYVREQFLPKERRRFGMWVLPILWGDRFVGRMDARLEKKERRLRIHAVYAEGNAPADPALPSALREELDDLVNFLGADSVAFTSRVPAAWKRRLR